MKKLSSFYVICAFFGLSWLVLSTTDQKHICELLKNNFAYVYLACAHMMFSCTPAVKPLRKFAGFLSFHFIGCG